ncbi:MAG: phosphoribosylformylglycinamidine cyclo-ligase [Spirochaetaceae bacterium]|nr:phosphoribosylformylglycinamidine cyclo-ligase [Spirochaetaceae bacterium]MCF7951199.1 phosphoribosylformylglycinamidine cyclo-ligase [Spirochaetaceae bacterium]
MDWRRDIMEYSDAGVDAQKGRDLVEKIRGHASSTYTLNSEDSKGGVLAGLGGFGALYQLGNYRNPVLVSGTDGVGTKLHLALKAQGFKNVGIDCVAMCVNDILCHGAQPLFFLDYLAYADIPAEKLSEVVEGVADGCRQAGCALVGGESAQMPGTYRRGDFDIAGFSVGVVERAELVDGSRVREGDLLIGLSSSGLHSNGFSLVRALISAHEIDLEMDFHGRPLIEELLTPTRIYTGAVLPLVQAGLVHGMAHITGGGLYENVPRMWGSSPVPLGACIRRGSWDVPPVFAFLEQLGVDPEEMYHTFNMGIGFVLAAAPEQSERVVRSVEAEGITAGVIGRIRRQEGICFE